MRKCEILYYRSLFRIRSVIVRNCRSCVLGQSGTRTTICERRRWVRRVDIFFSRCPLLGLWRNLIQREKDIGGFSYWQIDIVHNPHPFIGAPWQRLHSCHSFFRRVNSITRQMMIIRVRHSLTNTGQGIIDSQLSVNINSLMHCIVAIESL